MKYLTTFFTHHDALSFFAFLKEENISAKMMPTPRKISASCGACVQYESDVDLCFESHEIEAVYVEDVGSYIKVWENENI